MALAPSKGWAQFLSDAHSTVTYLWDGESCTRAGMTCQCRPVGWTNGDGSPVMVGKIQLIDDHRCSRLRHLLARCRETITPCRLASVGWTLAFLCDEVVKQALDACMRILPRVVFGTNQTEAAYHQGLRGNRKNRAPSLLRQRASRRATMRVH